MRRGFPTEKQQAFGKNNWGSKPQNHDNCFLCRIQDFLIAISTSSRVTRSECEGSSKMARHLRVAVVFCCESNIQNSMGKLSGQNTRYCNS